MPTCSICTNDSALIVRCPAVIEKKECGFEACRFCIRKYLLSQLDPLPKCMSCRSQWSFEFIAEHMSDDFYNKEYREYRAKIMFQREKSLFPSMQSYVSIVQNGTKVADEFTDITKKIREMEWDLNVLRERKAKLSEEAKVVKQIRKGNIFGLKTKEKHHNRFIGHCPYPKCNGYIGEDYACGLCHNKVCRSCRQVEHPNKECNKDDVETVKLLARDTKGCPKCNVPITKIDGCDQMYCMNCHTAFSWNSGRIETGRIHNPHYYQFMREKGNLPREQGDLRCGQVNLSLMMMVVRDRLGKNFERFVSYCHADIGHIREVVMPRYRATNVESNFDLRLRYMLNEIDESKFLSELKRRDKKEEKNEAIRQLLAMYCDTTDELFNSIAQSKNIAETKTFLKQILNLQEYVNAQFERIGNRFKNKMPTISPDGMLIDVGTKW